MVKRVGFIGLGDIGGPMAENLCEAFETVVFDLRPEAVAALVDAGARAGESCRDVASRSEVVCVCVLDDAGTKAVVLGEDGVLAGASEGCVIVLHSTIHPDTAVAIGAAAAERGVTVVDAQMTGGAAAVKAKTLRYMLGGDAHALDRCMPIFEASSSEITRCGALGMGAVAKLCNNLVQFNCWQAFEEGLRLAKHSGLEEPVILEILAWIMNDNARAFFAGRNARVANPGLEALDQRFDSVMLLAEKDLSLALQVARQQGVSMPMTGLSVQQLGRLFASNDPKRR